MTTKWDVIDLHRKHKRWTSSDIAQALGCGAAYVRATARRAGLTLPVKYPARQRAAVLNARRRREAMAAAA